MALSKGLAPSHPGPFIKEFKMKPAKVKVITLAKIIGVSRRHLSHVLDGHRRLDPTTAAKLGSLLHFNPAPLNRMQTEYDAWQVSNS